MTSDAINERADEILFGNRMTTDEKQRAWLELARRQAGRNA
jgi:hypothetical protein